MSCSQFINLQKTALLNLCAEDSEDCLNPFGSLLFSKSWKWNQQHALPSKAKPTQPAAPASLKKDILLWFENLKEQEKISVTAITASGFTQSFLKMLSHRKHQRMFNLPTERWVNGIEFVQEDGFFDDLLQQLRIGYFTEPVLYFKSSSIMDIRMLNWLNKVSNSRVFQYACKAKKDQQNPLWFSRFSFHYLQDWLANEIQISIVKHFFNKAVPEFFIPLLQKHLRGLSKHTEANALCLSLLQSQKKSKVELNLLKARLKQEEEKFLEYRQLKLIKSMEDIEQPTKKKNKKKGKKKLSKIEQASKENLNQFKEQQEITLVQTDNTNSPSNSIQKITQMPIQTSSVAVEEEKNLKQSNQHTTNVESTLIQQEKVKSNQNRKSSSSKNLIKVSPKRRLSPEQVRRQNIFDTLYLQEKYSEQDKSSFVMAEDEKSSDPAFSIEEQSLNLSLAEKKRRRRGKKENEKLTEVKQTLYSRLICRQIDNLVDELGTQTNSLYNHKIISFQRVRTFVQSLYPVANTILFGSNAIGLSLPNSDVDILLTGLNCNSREQASEFLAQIAVEINAMGWVVSCSTYLWAKVPIVKLEIDTSVPFLQTKRKQDLFRVYNPALLYHLDQVGEVTSSNIKVDITINIDGITSVGYESTILMREWMIKMPILQKLVLLLKYLLFYQGYNSNFAGGIGSYCLFVMVAAYIKENSREKTGDQSMEFLNILKWYGEDFDNNSNVVWLREEGTCFPSENVVPNYAQQGKRGLLQLIDPITGNYMNSSCNEYNNIKMQFRRIYQQLGDWRNLVDNELRLGGTTSPQLLKTVQSKKSIDKWLNRLEQKHQLGLRAVIERTS